MNIESLLIKKIGSVAGKIHTARSRNDQIVLDMKMYLKDEIKSCIELLETLRNTLIELSKKNIDVIMPGYTHTQRAQPVLFSHHLMAYYFMFKRDCERLNECLKRVNKMPLGSGALSGTGIKIDRKIVATILGFDEITENSMDSVSDRDFLIEFLSNCSIISMHLSRLAEELVLWSTDEFDFIEINDDFTTGSSMMPQKKNPDVAELIRGKTGRIYGNLVSLLVVMKGLPLTYNRDMQEDKEPVFDTVDNIKLCLDIANKMLKNIKINREKMKKACEESFVTATDVADYLVNKGIPFRESHKIVGKIVKYCISKNKFFNSLSLPEWKAFSKLFEKDIIDVIKPEISVEAKKSSGGTSKKEILKIIEKEGTNFKN
jgi:argininosuccinate lyase